MFKTSRCLVRSKGIFSFLKGKEAPAEAPSLTPEQQKDLRSALSSIRTDSPRNAKDANAADFDPEDIVTAGIDMDSIRARGRMRYRYCYNPPADLKSLVEREASSVFSEKVASLESFSLEKDNEKKAELITRLGEKLGHYPTNSRLVHLKTVQDVFQFFNEPVKNTFAYTRMARDTANPPNVHYLEQPVRFNPEDTHAWHGGVTAFPGTGGEVVTLRNKRLLRQFSPKKEWFDYEDMAFDYSPPDRNMPWDAEVAKKMDRVQHKRYNLSSKSFINNN